VNVDNTEQEGDEEEQEQEHAAEKTYYLNDEISLADIYLCNLLLMCITHSKHGWEDKFKEVAPKLHKMCDNILDRELLCYWKNVYLHKAEF